MFKFFLHNIKMEAKVLIFDKHCIVKSSFHRCKEPIIINKVDIERIVLSEKDSYGNKGPFKYFFGCGHYKIDIMSLQIILSQVNAYTKCFKDSKCKNVLVHDKIVLQKYSEIWNKTYSEIQ